MREQEIDKIMDILRVHPYIAEKAAALYDAGYRRRGKLTLLSDKVIDKIPYEDEHGIPYETRIAQAQLQHNEEEL